MWYTFLLVVGNRYLCSELRKASFYVTNELNERKFWLIDGLHLEQIYNEVDTHVGQTIMTLKMNNVAKLLNLSEVFCQNKLCMWTGVTNFINYYPAHTYLICSYNLKNVSHYPSHTLL